jgi:membrane protein
MISRWSQWPLVRRARQVRAVDVAINAAIGFARHRSGRNAALLAYYGFLALFPMLLLATAVLGFVLAGHPDWQASIVDSSVAQIPVLGDQILEQSGALNGSIVAVVIGVAGAAWGATRAFSALQDALDDIWEVAPEDRPNPVVRRAHSFIGLLVIGGGQLATVAIATFAGITAIPDVAQVLIALGGATVNVIMVGSMLRYLTAATATWHMVWRGAVLAGLAYTALQLVGTTVVARLLAGAQGVYGAFASVLAITGWLSIHASISLYAAEVNAVAASDIERCNDRSVTG